MEQTIAVLAAHVIDQIAAGEVVERPASVVKELVDNALDAGARTIAIETVAGGRGLVRVSDDGCGMSPRDALLAFERHATSKLREVDDLWGIASMGFRGEALPSIASVSRLTLTTRRQGDLAATRVAIEAARFVGVAEVGAPAGTTVEVRDLLHNLPARLKFMKGESTEAAHVTELVARLAMAHPRVHFRLRHGGRAALELPPDRDGLARARALLGPRVAARLVAVSGEEAGVRVTAYLGGPDLAQATARGVQLFVDRRPVRDRGLLHAVAMGYGELVPRGRYPVAVVLLDVPAGAVDVNVHPAKTEVRFADASAVTAAVRHVVQAGVASAPWRAETGATPVHVIASAAPPALPFDGHGATPLAQRYVRDLQRGGLGRSQASLAFDAPAEPRAWVAELRRSTLAGRSEHDRELARVDAALERAPRSFGLDVEELVAAAVRAEERGGEQRGVDQRGAEQHGVEDDAELADGSGPVAATAPGYFAQLRYLGQLDLTYLVCEAAGELVLIDQHAAHERVELARLIARASDHEVATQAMLFPVQIEATPAQLELVGRVGELLARVGYRASAAGQESGASAIAITAVPAGIRHGDPAQLLRRLLDGWAADGAPSEDERITRGLAEIACHSVVRAGDRLNPGEAEALLRALDGVDPGIAAPHGRALLVRLPVAELGRRFGRS